MSPTRSQLQVSPPTATACLRHKYNYVVFCPVVVSCMSPMRSQLQVPPLVRGELHVSH